MTDTPWHFWPIVLIAFLWHLIGAIDYTAIQYDFRPWLSVMGTEQRTFVNGLADWIDGCWAISVWLGLLGVLLMAGRAGFAPLVLAVSMIAGTIVAVWLTFLASPSILSLGGGWALLSLWLSVLFSVLLWLYAREQHRLDVLG